MTSKKESKQQREALRAIINAQFPDLCLRGARLVSSSDPILRAGPPFGGISDFRDFESEDGRQIRIHTLRNRSGRVYFMAASQPLTLSSAQSNLQPPMNAEFIMHLLLPKNDQDAVIGDLIERYGQKCERFGERRARVWFYCEVLRSVWPLLGAL